MEVWEIQQAYERWWLRKWLPTGRQIVKVEYIGNKVYGIVALTLDDGTTMYAPQKVNDYRPRKKNFVVFDAPPDYPAHDYYELGGTPAVIRQREDDDAS